MWQWCRRRSKIAVATVSSGRKRVQRSNSGTRSGRARSKASAGFEARRSKNRACTSLGGSAVPMAWGETYTAVQQGMVDGLELPLAFIDSLKVYEVTKYLSQTNHTYTALELLIGNRTLGKLSAEQRKAVADAAKVAVAEQRKTNYEHGLQMVSVLQGKGMKVNTVSDPAAFRKAVAPMYEKFKPGIGADLMTMALDQVK